MLLHEAIAYVLYQSDQPMGSREIAEAINSKYLYSRGDGKPLQTSQISARVNNHPELFERDDVGIGLSEEGRLFGESVARMLIAKSQELREEEISRTEENALAILPHLVHAAKQREIIVYEDLMAKIDKPAIIAGGVLGYIRDQIILPRRLPMLNAIVVNKYTQLPGESWLPEGTEHLSEDEYIEKFEQFRNDVFSFKGWGSLLKDLGLSPIEVSNEDLFAEARVYFNEILDQKDDTGETESHKNLKNFISQNPGKINLAPVREAEIDYQFISGDRADLVFELGNDEWAVVDIKTSENRGDLTRGVFQAIKYRALLKAELGKGTVHGYLVANGIPDEIKKLALNHRVHWYVIAE